jgi:oligopeptide/dipeptide ABC transporter ATP-binding protein
MSEPPLLSVRDLKKWYPLEGRRLGAMAGWSRAVDGVSFDIRRGEILGLVGESGSGKTTIGRATLRLIEPTAGEVHFDGIDVRAMSRSRLRAFRRRAQMVFQDPHASLDPRQTVRDALEEVLVVHRLSPTADARRRRVDQLLDRVGLDPSRGRDHPTSLSGGERQRVAIARALAVEPELLVLDEPVSALDVSVRAQVINLLVELRADLGLTFLFITHDLALVEYVSDRVMVVYLGHVIETAPATALCNEPRHPYTRALLSAVPADPRASGSRQRIILQGEMPDPANPPSGCPFHPRCPHPEKDDLCARQTPTLEAKAPAHYVACLKEPRRG